MTIRDGARVPTRTMAYFCCLVGWRASGDWLAGRTVPMRASVAQRLEFLILSDLLALHVDQGDAAPLVYPVCRRKRQTSTTPATANATTKPAQMPEGPMPTGCASTHPSGSPRTQ